MTTRGAHRVTKAISFCYGHRLLDYDGKCRHLHGHNGLVEIDIAADYLTETGMVIDFAEAKAALGGWIDGHLDHRMILSERDPIAPLLREAGEPLYLIKENPTAENLAMHIFRAARARGLAVTEVRLWETPTSCAAYSEGPAGP